MKVTFVQIKCELSKAFDVAAYLVDNVLETTEVYSISGNYDLLAKFELPDEKSVGDFVIRTLQVVPGVKDTNSIVAFKFQWNPTVNAEFEPRPETLVRQPK